MRTTAFARHRELILILGVCFVCFFWQLGRVELHDYNEGLYVAAAREMYLRGTWATPRWNGTYFFDKPPLALWCCAILFRILGINELATRLPVALATALLVLLTFWLGTRWFGRRAGLYAGWVLATSPMVLVTARQMTMDLHQSFWFAVAMACFYAGYVGESERARRWYYGMWAACGLGFMAKSVPGIFPLFLAFAFVCVEARFRWREVWRRVREAHVPSGLAIMLAIVLPWHYFAYRDAGLIFVRDYVHHHIGILTGSDYGHKEPVWYYIPSLLGGLFPWSLFLVPAVVRAWRSVTSPAPAERDAEPALAGAPVSAEPSGETTAADDGPRDRIEPEPLPPQRWMAFSSSEADRARRFLLVWALGLVLGFSGMASKLHSYVLPMYAAAALLIGDWLAAAVESRRERALPVTAVLAALASVAFVVTALVLLAHIAGTRQATDLHESLTGPAIRRLLIALATMTAALVAGAVLILARRRREGVGTMLGGMLVCVAMLVAWMLPAINDTINRPLHEVARVAGRYAAAGVPLDIDISCPTRPSVFFYMPPSLAVRPPDPKTEQVILSTGDPAQLAAFLHANRLAYIMTEAKELPAVLDVDPSLQIAMRRRQWLLLRSGPLAGGTKR